MSHYLAKAVNALQIYKTPEKILKVVEKHSLIKNPPYDVRKSTK